MKLLHDFTPGSGAFLIETFDYLMKIPEYIKEQIASFNISASYSLTEDITSSILFEYGFKYLYSGQNLGKSAYQYNKVTLEKLPIKPYENKTYLEDKVTEILATNKKISDYKILLERVKFNKKYDEIIDLEKLLEDSQLLVQKLEYEINQEVYKIYGLTQKEIDFIEKNI